MIVDLLPHNRNCPVLTFVSRIYGMEKKVSYRRVASKVNEKRCYSTKSTCHQIIFRPTCSMSCIEYGSTDGINYSRHSKLRSWDIFIKSGFNVTTFKHEK